MAIDHDTANTLYSGQRVNLDCWYGAIEQLNTTYLDLGSNFSEMTITLAGGNVDADFDRLGTNILQVRQQSTCMHASRFGHLIIFPTYFPRISHVFLSWCSSDLHP